MLTTKTVWLITWEPNFKDSKKIATILNSRTSSEKVKDILEQLYVNSEYSLSERLLYAKSKKNNPYPVRFDILDEIPWWGKMSCGNNPYLYARKVKNLRLKINGDENEYLEWQEIEKPKLNLPK